MTDHLFDDRNTTGGALPEDSQHLLMQVGHQLRLLARLAQPRPGGKRKQAPGVGAAELAFSLDQLAGQVEAVLLRMSRPAQAGAALAAAEAAAPYAADEATQAQGPRLAFGATLAQLDALQLLVSGIKAFGDAVFAEQAADYAEGSVSMLGFAIFNQASEVADLLTEIAAQPLAPGGGSASVREVRLAYGGGSVLALCHDAQAAPRLPQAVCRMAGAMRLH